MTIKPMKHQVESLKFCKTRKRVFDASDPGCVSADTEFLTPTGWKRIDQYIEGDKVAQFHPDTREIEFVTPLQYVKRPCSRMIAIAPARGTSQRLSHEHRVLFYRPDGSYGVMSAQDYAQQLHQRGPSHFKSKFCCTYSVRGFQVLDYSDADLRVMVAVIADGHFPNKGSTRCTIRLKKGRKIERLRHLLLTAQISYEERQCGGQPEFQVFRFDAPGIEKEFGVRWWGATQYQLEIIANELPHWDSSQDKRPSHGTRFSTFVEATADFAQYAFAAAKRPASKAVIYRDRRNEDRGVMAEYVVHAQAEDKLVGPGRRSSVYEVPNPEGFKYCFEVPTSFLLLRHNGYIFATGNTGKTYVQIMDFAQQHKKDGKALLVVCPKSLMKAAWANDIKKFAPHLRVSIAWAKGRLDALNAEADVYIVNHDGVKDLLKYKPAFWKKFNRIVIDESTAFKHHTSQRSRAMAKLVKYFEWRRAMSGTATSNGICDLWHQMFIIDDGKRLGKSFFGFRSACCNPVQTGPSTQHLNWVDKPGIETAVSALIADITIRHKFEECVDIPQNHMYALTFELAPRHMKTYLDLEADSIARFETGNVTAINGAVLATKLLQTASGAVYDDRGGYAKVASDRYELVMDLVEERAHSIVFYQWQHQLEELLEIARKREITHVVWDPDRPDIEQEYQAGFYQVLFAHPASAGHGLTLTKGLATIWASPTYNLEHFAQGYKRIYRIGQKHKTETIVVVAENTIDERVWAACQAKRVRMNDLMEELKCSRI